MDFFCFKMKRMMQTLTVLCLSEPHLLQWAETICCELSTFSLIISSLSCDSFPLNFLQASPCPHLFLWWLNFPHNQQVRLCLEFLCRLHFMEQWEKAVRSKGNIKSFHDHFKSPWFIHSFLYIIFDCWVVGRQDYDNRLLNGRPARLWK